MSGRLLTNLRCLCWPATLLLVVNTAGCGFKVEKFEQQMPEQVDPKGFESPQAAYAALGAAVKQNDFVAITRCITDETATAFAGGMMISGALLKASGGAGLEIDRVLNRHGLDASALEDVRSKIPALLQDPISVSTLAEPIDDKRLFVADMLQALHTLGQPLPLTELQPELTRWEIDGDIAIGAMERPDGKLERIAFRKRDLGWQVHFEVRGNAQDAPAAAPEPVAGETPATPAASDNDAPPAEQQ